MAPCIQPDTRGVVLICAAGQLTTQTGGWEVKKPEDLMASKGILLGLQTVLLCYLPTKREKKGEGRREKESVWNVCENERILVSSSPYKGPNPIMGPPPPWPHPKPNYFLKSPTANTTSSEIKASPYEFWRTREHLVQSRYRSGGRTLVTFNPLFWSPDTCR